jgi:hypothetical protein
MGASQAGRIYSSLMMMMMSRRDQKKKSMMPFAKRSFLLFLIPSQPEIHVRSGHVFPLLLEQTREMESIYNNKKSVDFIVIFFSLSVHRVLILLIVALVFLVLCVPVGEVAWVSYVWYSRHDYW